MEDKDNKNQHLHAEIPIVIVSMITEDSSSKRVRLEVPDHPAVAGMSKAMSKEKGPSFSVKFLAQGTTDGKAGANGSDKKEEEKEVIEEDDKEDDEAFREEEDNTPKLEEGYNLPEMLYRTSSFFYQDVEDVQGYRRGGYHPVTIGDRVGGKYKIIHKLGFGGFATVWLAHDLEAQHYVALKIIKAQYSNDAAENDLKILQYLANHAQRPGGNFLDLPIDDFWITGPNGKHLCIVSEVAGPSIAHLTRTYSQKIKQADAQVMALQVTQCLAFLHSAAVGIGHGDLTTSNILLELGNLDALSQEKILEILGEPVANRLEPFPGKILGPGAPEFIYQGANMTKLSKFYTGDIIVIDFGSSFFLIDPPDGVGTPVQFCSPELIFDKLNGKASDVWALACTIFEMRAGEPLFECFDGKRELVRTMISVLGPLPENYTDCAEWDSLRFVKGDREKLGKMVATIKGISEDERMTFYDLLSQMVAYNVEERLNVDEVLRHSWFSYSFR